MIVVDRIINEIAVCIKEDKSIDIPISSIDGQVKEGAVLIPNAAGDRYHVDDEETGRRRSELTTRFRRLQKKRE